jgi:TolB-like protein
MTAFKRVLLVAALLVPVAATAAQKKVRVAVMEFRPLGTEQAKADLLSEIALTRASMMRGFEVIGRSDIASMIGFEKQKAVVGCSDDYGCLAEVGGALGVDLVMVGTLGRLGSLYRIDLKLVDTKKARVRGRIGVTVEEKEEKLVAAVEKAVRDLLEPETPIDEPTPPPVAAVTRPAEKPAKAAPPPAKVDLKPAPPEQRAELAPEAPETPRGEGKSKALGWTAFGTAIATVGLAGFSVYEGLTAKSAYDKANGMVGADGALLVSASVTDYKSSVTDGDDAKKMAVMTGGAAAGCAVITGVLGYISYRQTGEVGPIRF